MFWSKKKQNTESAIQGHEVHVNPRPGTLHSHQRNIERVKRIKLSLEKLKKKGLEYSVYYEDLKDEMEQREIAIRRYKRKRGGLK